MLAAQLVPCGVPPAKRGVHSTGTISPGLQLPAALPYDFGEPAVEMIALATLQHADVLVDEGIPQPSHRSHACCLVGGARICSIQAGTPCTAGAAPGREDAIGDKIADHRL